MTYQDAKKKQEKCQLEMVGQEYVFTDFSEKTFVIKSQLCFVEHNNHLRLIDDPEKLHETDLKREDFDVVIIYENILRRVNLVDSFKQKHKLP